MGAYQIEISSRAVFEPLQPGTRIPNSRLASLQGLRIARNVADDLDADLQDVGLTGGEVRVEWDRAQKKLIALATFLAPARLTKEHERLLIDAVRGQYSDGLAENGISVKRPGLQGRLWLDRDRKLKIKQVPSAKKLVFTGQLLQPARLGNLEEVERLIASGARVNATGAYGVTPLINAIHNDHEAVISVLLAAGAEADRCTDRGTAPLQHACMSSASVRTHRLLLKAGADVNAMDEDGRTALHYAANRGLLAVSRLLIEYGANVNAQDGLGRTPLMLASEDHPSVIKFLLLSGARTDLRNDQGLRKAQIIRKFKSRAKRPRSAASNKGW